MKSILVLVSLVFIVSTPVQASTPVQGALCYETGFEDPPFVIGPVNGQDGWFNDGSIQTGVVKSGNQALYIDGSGFGFFVADRWVGYAVSNEIVRLQVDFLRSLSGTAQAGIAVGGNTGFLAQIATLGPEVYLGNSNSNTPLQAFTPGVWHQLRIYLDFGTQTVEGFVDGVSLGVLALNPAGGPASQIDSVGVYSFGTAGTPQDVYFDNFSISLSLEDCLYRLVALNCSGVPRRDEAACHQAQLEECSAGCQEEAAPAPPRSR